MLEGNQIQDTKNAPFHKVSSLVVNANSIPLTFTTTIMVDQVMPNTFAGVHGRYWFFNAVRALLRI